MYQRRLRFRLPSLLILALSASLGACGGGSSNNNEGPADVDPIPLTGGRLVYALDGAADTLKMYDQTVASDRFTGSTVSATSGAELVLSNDGLTLAMLEQNGRLSVVSSGLEHLDDSNPHTHELSVASAVAISAVSKVVATTDHFSILREDGTSTLLESSDGAATTLTWNNVVYPTLALEGGQFLKFTANVDDDSITDISVVDENDSTGDEGLIFVRPNVDGFFTPAMSCVGGVQQTAQTEDFTVVLCGDGTLRWLISGFVAPVDHPAAGQTLHVTQRYPATATRREGAIGEVTADAAGFIENITRLNATRAEGDVIAAWADDQLWLINAHGDHPHRANLYAALEGSPNLVAAAAATEDDAMTILADDGKAFVFRFTINESSNPVIVGDVFAEQLGSANATWSSDRAHLAPGPFEFFVINRDTGTLYQLDAHDPEGDYHLHATFTHSDLADAHSAVFTHAIDGEHRHDHGLH
jgi:hypothetical protein